MIFALDAYSLLGTHQLPAAAFPWAYSNVQSVFMSKKVLASVAARFFLPDAAVARAAVFLRLKEHERMPFTWEPVTSDIPNWLWNIKCSSFITDTTCNYSTQMLQSLLPKCNAYQLLHSLVLASSAGGSSKRLRHTTDGKNGISINPV